MTLMIVLFTFAIVYRMAIVADARIDERMRTQILAERLAHLRS